ncbi:Uncharacterised protein [Vibrio cholerae]|nr:Uncharacterised protein [Vibrio cholerae]
MRFGHRRFRQLVHQLHDCRNRCVERLATCYVIRHFSDGFVHIAAQRFLVCIQC